MGNVTLVSLTPLTPSKQLTDKYGHKPLEI